LLIDYDAAFKICSDIFLGRPWPVAFGTGIGLGMGYSNCQNDFQQPNILHGKRIKVHVYYMNLNFP
jgi:inner membrane organizing system protein 1